MFDTRSYITSLTRLFSKKELLLIIGMIVLFFLTRLIKLDGFPIFSDEGIYIHWAKVAWHDANWRFISLTDGKQPLQTWGTIPFLKIFSTNLLLGGRMFSVFTGYFAFSGLFILLFYLFGKKAALYGGFMYILTPYFLFYDRLAMVDSGVNAFFIWILLLSLILIRTLQLDFALLFGFTSGLGLLAKSSVQLFLGLSLFAPISILPMPRKKFTWYAFNYIVLYSIGAIIALTIYNIQRLSPFFQFVSEKNKTFIITFDEFIKNPLGLVAFNAPHLPLYIFWESGFIVSLLGVLGLIVLLKKNKSLGLYFLIWIVLPYIAIVLFNKVLFPRYIMFFATLLVILAGYFVSQIKNKRILYISLLTFLISVIYFDYTIIADYKNIPLPPVDRGQYIEAWPAGWGIKEIMQFARERSQEKPVILLAEGNFGMTGDVLDVFLQNTDKISIKGYWPLGEQELINHQKDLNNNYVYAVFAHREEFPENWSIRLVKKYEKPGNKAAIYLYEVIK